MEHLNENDVIDYVETHHEGLQTAMYMITAPITRNKDWFKGQEKELEGIVENLVKARLSNLISRSFNVNIGEVLELDVVDIVYNEYFDSWVKEQLT